MPSVMASPNHPGKQWSAHIGQERVVGCGTKRVTRIRMRQAEGVRYLRLAGRMRTISMKDGEGTAITQRTWSECTTILELPLLAIGGLRYQTS